jgi:hypothetical protein
MKEEKPYFQAFLILSKTSQFTNIWGFEEPMYFLRSLFSRIINNIFSGQIIAIIPFLAFATDINWHIFPFVLRVRHGCQTQLIDRVLRLKCDRHYEWWTGDER